jgi:uncharacterized protein YjdB
MPRFTRLLLSLTLVTLATACSDQTGTSPTAPGVRMTITPPTPAEVQAQIDALFPLPGLRNAATKQFGNVQRDLSAGRTTNAREKVFALEVFTNDKLAHGQLLDPDGTGPQTPAGAAKTLIASLYMYVGLVPTGAGQSAGNVDASIELIGPSTQPQIVRNENKSAAVYFPGNSVPTFLIVTIDRLPNPTPAAGVPGFSSPYRQYARAYEAKTDPVVTFSPSTGLPVVSVCPVEPNPLVETQSALGAAPDPSRLILAHGVNTPEGPSSELLTRIADPSGLDCDEATLARADDPRPAEGGLRLASWMARESGRRIMEAVTPRSAYALHGGLAGATTSFSPFVPVDTFAVASVGVAPSTALVGVGQTVQLTATARNVKGADVTASVTPAVWQSSDAGIATVTQSGVVQGVAAGPVTITATIEGVANTAVVTVGTPITHLAGNFETYPNASPACNDRCPVSNEFFADGVVFSFVSVFGEPTGAVEAATLGYDTNNPSGVLNHFITNGRAPDNTNLADGVLTMTFPGLPHTVGFKARVNTQYAATFVIKAYSASGALLYTTDPTGSDCISYNQISCEGHVGIYSETAIHHITIDAHVGLVQIDDLEIDPAPSPIH